jgi:hypothetical protein
MIAALILPLGLDTLAIALALGLRPSRRGYGGARRTPPGAIWKYAGCCTQRPSV